MTGIITTKIPVEAMIIPISQHLSHAVPAQVVAKIIWQCKTLVEMTVLGITHELALVDHMIILVLPHKKIAVSAPIALKPMTLKKSSAKMTQQSQTLMATAVTGMLTAKVLVAAMMTLISQHLLLAVFALGVVEMMLLSPILTEMDVTGTTVIQIHVVHMTTLDSLHQ